MISKWFFFDAEMGTFILNYDLGSFKCCIESEFCFMYFLEEQLCSNICSANSLSFSKLPDDESDGIDMFSTV